MNEIEKTLKLVPSDSENADGPKVYTFRASDGDYDRVNDRINPKGWLLDSYRSNPIVLFNHRDGAPSLFSGPQMILPIGKADARIENNALVADITFDQNDAYAQKIEQKVADGYLNAVSVRFRPIESTQNEKGGTDYSSVELLEISVVNIPCNSRATRLKSLDDQLDAFADLIIEKLVAKGLTFTSSAATDTPAEIKSVPESVSDSPSEDVTDSPAEAQAEPVADTSADTTPGIDFQKAASILAGLLNTSLETLK